MKLFRAGPELLLLPAVALLLAPGITSLIPTPYGLSATHLWLAAIYIGAAAWVTLVLCVRILGATRYASRSILSVGLLVVAFVLFTLLPFGALMAGYYFLGAFAGGSAWLLFNKYLGHLASSAFGGYFWVISLCLVGGAVGMATARGAGPSPHPTHVA